MERLGPAIRSEIWRILLDQHKRDVEENKLVFLRLGPENAYGDRDLKIYKQNLLPVTLSICRESRAYTLKRIPKPLRSGKGVVNAENDILLFSSDVAARVELYQTAPLRHIAGIKTIAVDPARLQDQETLRELLMTIYSHLRNIETIILVAHRLHPTHIHCRRYTPLRIADISSVYAADEWIALRGDIQQMVRSAEFWRDCNARYAMEQILPVAAVPRLCVPEIRSMEMGRRCAHDVDPCRLRLAGPGESREQRDLREHGLRRLLLEERDLVSGVLAMCSGLLLLWMGVLLVFVARFGFLVGNAAF
ncbi:hypothetical protein F4861DRAFT_189509 [Xylaria intraflava]|nr:hypothetical protein F4861DRAFT_189509 [Xylaria intraflava]